MARQDLPPPAGPPAAGDDDYVDVPAAARVLRKRWRLGAGVWLATVLVCAAYAFSAVPRYTAVATLLIDLDGPRILAFSDSGFLPRWYWEDYLRTQQEMLTSRALASRVLDRTGLGAHRELAPSPQGPPADAGGPREAAVIDRFLGGLRVAPVPGTHLISVSFTSGDPALAADVANAVAEEHVARDREARDRRARETARLRRAGEAYIEGAPAVGGVSVVDDAETPVAPSSPDRRRLLFLALAGGLAAAGVVVFAADRLDGRLTSAADVREHLGQPVLGVMPRVAAADTDAGRAPRLDALRFVRANLVFASAPRGRRVVAVTSALPGEGKTLAAVELAETLAQTGRRVLLIDADCRRPAVHDRFGLPARPGLADMLSESDVVPEPAWSEPVPNLAVLTSGGTPANPADLLESAKFAALLAELADGFDWTLIDTPPVLSAPDAALVAHAAGDTLLLVDAARPSRRPAAAALRQIEAAGARCLGVVLNGIDAPGSPWFASPGPRRDRADDHRHA